MSKHNDQPFKWNMAALAIIPISAVNATTATAQIDAIYAVADDPATDPQRAVALLRLANKCLDKLNARQKPVDDGSNPC